MRSATLNSYAMTMATTQQPIPLSEIAERENRSEKTIRRLAAKSGWTIKKGMVYMDTQSAIVPAPKPDTAPTKPKAAPTPRRKVKLNLPVIFSAVLVSADSLAFAWIAYNSYQSFRVAAGAIFALIGFAVGYSAIKNIITYKGWNADAWGWGFGFFQLGLHLSAMQVIGPYSFLVGKVFISLGLPLAVAGLAISMRHEANR